MPINHVIKEKRKEMRLTQEQIADYLGVSTPAVNKWEKARELLELLPPLIAELESSPQYDFLQSNVEFQQFIRSYRSKY